MNAEVVLPLDQMTPIEKLGVIQTILADMAQNAGDADPPTWHGHYLEQREKAIADGTDSFIDLDQAEREILEMTR